MLSVGSKPHIGDLTVIQGAISLLCSDTVKSCCANSNLSNILTKNNVIINVVKKNVLFASCFFIVFFFLLFFFYVVDHFMAVEFVQTPLSRRVCFYLTG